MLRKLGGYKTVNNGWVQQPIAVMRIQEEQQVLIGQALFLVLNSLDRAIVPAKDLLPFQVVQEVDNFYTEDAYNQIGPIYSSLARQQLIGNLILPRVSSKRNKYTQTAVFTDNSY